MSVWEREINELSLPSIPFVLMAAEAGSCCLERESEAAEGTLIHALNSFHTILTQQTLPFLFKVGKFEDMQSILKML